MHFLCELFRSRIIKFYVIWLKNVVFRLFAHSFRPRPPFNPIFSFSLKTHNHNPKTDFRSYFLTFDDGARLELMHKPEMPDQPKELSRTGYAHIAFRVGSREKVNALTAELKADGYKVISGPRTTGDGYYESCIAAIEGNQIELTV